MNPSSDFPELAGLRLVELDRLLLHESHDDERLSRLRKRIEQEGVQANPVIVSAVEDESPESFLVLDGAHRVRTLRETGGRLALVQVVSSPDGAEGWQHYLPSGVDGWFAGRRLLEGVSLRESNGAADSGGVPRPVARIDASDGRTFVAEPLVEGVAARVEALWALRGIYPEQSLVTRVSPGRDAAPGEEGAVIVRYTDFSLSEILQTISLGAVLPAGVTRFSVPRRILGVKFPLESLRSPDVEAATRTLQDLVSERLRENRVRRYDEPILLFE